MKKILIILCLSCLPCYATEGAYSKFTNPQIYNKVLQDCFKNDIRKLSFNQNHFECFYFALDSLELKTPNPRYLKKWEKKMYGVYLTKYIQYSFLQMLSNVDEEYKDLKNDPLKHTIRRKLYYQRTFEYSNKQVLKKEITEFINKLEKQGYLENYKVVDLLSYNLFCIMLYNKWVYFTCNNGDNSENALDEVLFQLLKHNDDKPQALYNTKYFQTLYYTNQDYFEGYHDKNHR